MARFVIYRYDQARDARRIAGVGAAWANPGEQADWTAMLIAVLMINLLLTLLCWWAIWRLWQVRQQLAEATQQLSWAKSQAQSLQDFSATLTQRQQSLQESRQRYRQLLLYFRQGQQLLGLLGWMQLRRAGSTSQGSRNGRRR